MTDITRWQEINQAYLGAALRWLRLLLEHGAAAIDPAAELAPDVNGPEARSSATGAGPAPVTEEDIAAARAAMTDVEAADPPPAAIILCELLGLSRFELDVLLLCAAMELDSRIAGLCARAQPGANRPHPTFALALRLFSGAAWDALSPERPLRRWRLLDINQPGAQSLTMSALRADERIVSYLKGLNYLDDRLTPFVLPLARVDPVALPPSQQSVVDAVVSRIKGSSQQRPLPVVQLIGPDSSSKQLVAWHVASALGLGVYRLPTELIPNQAGELETMARLWQRESMLLPIALYLDASEMDRGADGQSSSLNRFLARTTGVVFLDTRDVRQCPDRLSQAFDVGKPTAAEQHAAWKTQLGESSNGFAGELAEQFDLGLGAIARIAEAADTPLVEGERDRTARLWEACLGHTRPRLNALAQRLEPKAQWDDLVLPEAELTALQQITAQAGQRAKVYDTWGFRRKMSRGLGITALFAGASGTGKTMAAEVIANALGLGLNLYRIDLSAVVSKYIGETEKNLSRLFDAADEGGAILFFDEADALFGKRSEVKDSHDRYANIEINYLLQRMEGYRGLAILATNMKSALDQAFLRRLRFIVNFPFPSVAERKTIWQKVFPAETETAGLDFDRLATLALTGGSIHNVALNAAFLAAQARVPVSMTEILESARSEFRKLEKPVNELAFRQTGSAPAPR
jgi:ATPase family associated with various cellular activities (AAA)